MYGGNGSSDAISRDMNSLLHSSTFKHPTHGEFAKIKQLISSDGYPNYDYPSLQKHDETYGENQSSFFSNLLNESGDDEFPFSTVVKQERTERDVQSNDNRNRRDLDYELSFRDVDSTRLNLVRQISTPAGFLSQLNAGNGIGSMKKGSPSKLNSHISFSSAPSSSPSRFLPQIAENENELHDSMFSSLKRSREGILKMPQNGDHTPNLVHHMSLPKTSSEMAVVDNFLRFPQQSMVPWKTRAKRGFATHPRSIAERVRRTRISERIKRLQELFPEIDKNSNTADMLDMAVEYIRNLQKELQTLSDARARCKCSSEQ